MPRQPQEQDGGHQIRRVEDEGRWEAAAEGGQLSRDERSKEFDARIALLNAARSTAPCRERLTHFGGVYPSGEHPQNVKHRHGEHPQENDRRVQDFRAAPYKSAG